MKIFAIAMILAICMTASSAKDIYAESYDSIQNAINAAKDGDTVYAKGGVYKESLAIGKSIKLIGSYDGNETVIDGSRMSMGMYVYKDNVEITGFTILNPNTGIWVYNSNNCSIYNNTVENVNDAIYIDSGGYNNIYQNKMANCCDHGIYLARTHENKVLKNEIVRAGVGIYSYNCSNNAIYKNNITDICHDGMQIYSSTNNTIAYNNIFVCRGDGINLGYSNGNVLHNNSIGEVSEGIYLYNSSKNRIHGSIIVNYYNNGMELRKSTRNRIFNNTIENTLQLSHQIMCFDYSNNNIIYRNGLFGIKHGNHKDELYLYNSNDNWIFLNNFINTTLNQYLSKNKLNTTKVNYTYQGKNHKNYLGNYYNDYKGTDSNEDGIGDTAYKIDSTLDEYPLVKLASYYTIE